MTQSQCPQCGHYRDMSVTGGHICLPDTPAPAPYAISCTTCGYHDGLHAPVCDQRVASPVREFWVPHNEYGLPTHIAWHEYHPDLNAGMEPIHVIEKSYATRLEQERDTLRAEVEKLRAACKRNPSSGSCIEALKEAE